MSDTDKVAESKQHYQRWHRHVLTPEEMKTGAAMILMDPYRVCDIYQTGGGAREQIVKKGLRWTSKGDSEEKVLTEIMAACKRRLEMLQEDSRQNVHNME